MTWADGFTVIVNCSAAPVHKTPLLSYVGITLMVATCEMFDTLINSKDGIEPVPVSDKPIDELSFVQSYVVIPSVLDVLNIISFEISPLQNTWLWIEFTWAVGFTVKINSFEGPVHSTPLFV